MPLATIHSPPGAKARSSASSTPQMNDSSPCGGQAEASGRCKGGDGAADTAGVASPKSAAATIESLDLTMVVAMSFPFDRSCRYHNELFRT
jgi:hypothetical protein